MKVFKFPGNLTIEQDAIKTAKFHKYEKDLFHRSPKQSQLKKTGSLDLSYYYSNKNKQIRKVYKVYSLDKKVRAKSTNSSKSTNQLRPSAKPSNMKIQNARRDMFHPQKKIFIKSQKKAKNLFSELRLNLQLLNQKLEKCLETKSQKLFIQQYSEILRAFDQRDSKQNECQIIPNLLANITKCQSKKLQKRFQMINQKIVSIQKQKSHLTVQIKKVKLKQQVLNQEIKKLTDKNIQLSKEMKKYKQKIYSNQCTQTIQLFQLSSNPNVAQEMQKQFPKLIQQMREMKNKQGRMSILIGQLQRDGVNLQKVYNRGVKYNEKQIKKQKQKSKQKSDYDSSEQQQQQQMTGYENKQKSIERKTKKQKQEKKMAKKATECDADQSIIDQMDAISFDYEDKQDQPEVYTPRRIYVCQKPMDQNLKKQLQLNLDCLYEEYQQNGSGSKNFPTI